MNQDVTALQLSGNDRAVYARSLQSIQKFGMTLDVVAAEYAAARDKLGSASLLETVDFYDRFGRTIKEVKSVPLVVEELVLGIKADGVSEYHSRDMTKRLGAFAETFPGPISTVHAKDIAEWLKSLRKEDRRGNKYPIAPKTRNPQRSVYTGSADCSPLLSSGPYCV